MKVTIIKGPYFEETENRAHKLLYEIIMKKVNEEKKGESEGK